MWMDLRSHQTSTLTINAADVQWSPDGKYLTFRAAYGNRYGLYRAELVVSEDGRSAQLETPLQLIPLRESNHFLGHTARSNHAWSPDGRYIAYVAADPASCGLSNDSNAPVIIDRALFKGRTQLSDGCLTRIFLLDARGGQKPEILTPGPFDSHSLDWSPDGRQLVFVSNRSGKADLNHNNDLWTVDIESREVRQVTDSPGTEHAPRWSPDGEWIAFPATRRPVNTKDSPAENTALALTRPDGTGMKILGEDLDRRVSDLQWSPDGNWVYFKIPHEGKNCLYRASPDGETEAVICPDGFVGDYHLSEEKLLYTYQTPVDPPEIYQADPDGMFKERLSFHSRDWTREHELAELEEFWFDSFDGTRVQAFVALPVGAGGQIPVVHLIHGGPHSMYGHSFSMMVQVLAGAGYGVVFINPRGSSGYGQAFADGTLKSWGEGDYQDLMLGLDAALQKYPQLDGNRAGVIGGSYGGYMANWIVTQTKRYKAAVSIASVSNLISFYGNSLYSLLIESEFGVKPWEDYDLLWQHSPMAHVPQVETPTLLLHGEDDNDVPIEQAEEFFLALQKRDVPSRLVRYPNEGHGIRIPSHREHYYGQILAWFGKYLDPGP